ncbi:MAG: hypothetical protein WBW41_07985 [Verrucomicrobiia bacterium]
MKCYSFAAILLSFVVCGCESRENGQIPVTVLPSSLTDMAQQKNRQHLQGDSWHDDWEAALSMEERLSYVPECRDYILEVTKNLSPPTYTNCPDGVSFYARLEIYQDGSIGSVAVYGWTNAVYVPLYIQAIKKSHIPKWPARMHSIVGQDYFIMWLNTGVYPVTPGPD